MTDAAQEQITIEEGLERLLAGQATMNQELEGLLAGLTALEARQTSLEAAVDTFHRAVVAGLERLDAVMAGRPT